MRLMAHLECAQEVCYDNSLTPLKRRRHSKIMNRRCFLSQTLTSAAALSAGALTSSAHTPPEISNVPDKPKPAEVLRRRGPLDLKLGVAFVGAGHNNLPSVKELVAQEPNLVVASWDWGGGDWETALGGASHTGRRDIAEFLL